ncbi:MAG: HU family DNA-binding protein [Desulfovibrionaceae bacterium]|nr:HU family DNA-binding protein [Desulfovibrionaceae bacterium]
MSTTLTREELLAALKEHIPAARENSAKYKDVLTTLLNCIGEGLKRDGCVLISGFGKFECYPKLARRVRNPRTGEALNLPAHNVIVFRVSGKLREALNLEQDEIC